VGALNALVSMSATAIPSALPVMAVFIALTISLTSLVFEPCQSNLVLNSALASCAPYWVGTKNGFVVTWLTNTKRYLGVDGKSPGPPLSSALLLSLSSLDLPQAATAAATAAPPPSRAERCKNERRAMPGRTPS
jgi:hypothetical protein